MINRIKLYRIIDNISWPLPRLIMTKNKINMQLKRIFLNKILDKLNTIFISMGIKIKKVKD